MPKTDKQGEQGQAGGGPRGPGRPWRSSLWLWPAAGIALTGLAGTAFGTLGALLVGGEALATLLITAGILLFGRNRLLATGLVAALTAALVVLAGVSWLHELHHKSLHPVSAASEKGSWTLPLDWSRRRISQNMARQANFRGADLNDANLDGLQLAHKNFDGAQADGATFRGSQLEDASLRGASLQDACLQGANLTGADLSGADFKGADVAGVKIESRAKKTALAWPNPHSTPAAACQ